MHVAVLGAGYAGIALARRLESRLPDGVDLTVVDERDTHLVQHLVHRVLRDPALARDLQVPLAELLDRATHRQARVEGIRLGDCRVDLADGHLSYDVAAVCLGSRTATYGLPGVAEHGTPLKRVRHARAIRDRFLEVCETGGSVAVGGGGTSGVQVAGELAALAADRGGADDGSDADGGVDVRLLEQEPTLVPDFPAPFRRAVRDELTAAGVTVRTDAAIERADRDEIALADGTAVPADQFVWTGGITGRDAMASERPRVNATLRHGDRTFVLGDAAKVVDADGTAVPASAQSALGQARVAARNVTAVVDHLRSDGAGFEPRLATYRYDPTGRLVSVGDSAVAQVGPAVLRGAPARAVKSAVGVGYLGSVGRVRGIVDLLRDRVRDRAPAR